jgi:hypothetical protein
MDERYRRGMKVETLINQTLRGITMEATLA